MDLQGVRRESEYRWVIDPEGAMRVPAVLYADAALLRDMDDKVRQQICNVASLPGIVGAAYAMPDAHWGYGFPIGGVAAFDAEAGGVVSAGGVGFDISCGVRTLVAGMHAGGRGGCAGTARAGTRARHSRRRRQHRPAAALGFRNGRHAYRRRPLGRGPGLRFARPTSGRSRKRLHRERRSGCAVAARTRAAARGDGYARFRAITTSRCSGSTEVYDAAAAAAFGLRPAVPWSASTAARAASAIRWAPITCATWRSPRLRSASRCPIASSRAHRSAPNSAGATSARCARR